MKRFLTTLKQIFLRNVSQGTVLTFELESFYKSSNVPVPSIRLFLKRLTRARQVTNNLDRVFYRAFCRRKLCGLSKLFNSDWDNVFQLFDHQELT